MIQVYAVPQLSSSVNIPGWILEAVLTIAPAYPEYAASVLASNDFFRSMIGRSTTTPSGMALLTRLCTGAGMPLAAHGLFVNLGIDWENTLLACRTVLFIPIPWVLLLPIKGTWMTIFRFVLFKWGPWLRNKSPRALHDKEFKKAREDAEAVEGLSQSKDHEIEHHSYSLRCL